MLIIACLGLVLDRFFHKLSDNMFCFNFDSFLNLIFHNVLYFRACHVVPDCSITLILVWNRTIQCRTVNYYSSCSTTPQLSAPLNTLVHNAIVSVSSTSGSLIVTQAQMTSHSSYPAGAVHHLDFQSWWQGLGWNGLSSSKKRMVEWNVS